MNESPEAQEGTAQWYADYYRTRGADRNDVLRNRGVLFQHLAHEAAYLRALRHVLVDWGSAQILDVGCGSGGSLVTFLAVGSEPRNLWGVDILPERVEEAQRKFPSMHFETADARELPYGDASFDVTCESTMFVQLTDESMASAIADEMIRVTRPGGYIVLSDWRYNRPGDKEYVAVSSRRIARLFGVGSRTVSVAAERGSLVPPIGRRLSAYAPWAYFLVHAVIPALAGHVVTVLRRASASQASG